MQIAVKAQPAEEVSPTQALSEFLATIRYESLPDAVVARTEELFLDWQAPRASDHLLHLVLGCGPRVLSKAHRLVFQLGARQAVVGIAFRRSDLLLELAAIDGLHRHAAHPASRVSAIDFRIEHHFYSVVEAAQIAIAQ